MKTYSFCYVRERLLTNEDAERESWRWRCDGVSCVRCRGEGYGEVHGARVRS